MRQLHNDPAKKFCPICGTAQHFLPFGIIPRAEVKCPKCNSKDRHRLIWLFFTRKTTLFADRNHQFLHIAPEKCFIPKFTQHFGGNYIRGDLHKPQAAVHLDITELPFADQTFDYTYCSHVLEHVEKDTAAMREFYRTLKPNGSLIIMVPLNKSGITYEDPSIVTPQDREQHFGQHDHLRHYGLDIVDRLRDSGFAVNAIKPDSFLTEQDICAMGLKKSHTLFHCTKSE